MSKEKNGKISVVSREKPRWFQIGLNNKFRQITGFPEVAAVFFLAKPLLQPIFFAGYYGALCRLSAQAALHKKMVCLAALYHSTTFVRKNKIFALKNSSSHMCGKEEIGFETLCSTRRQE